MPKPTFKNLDAIPNWKLREILDSNFCTGTDGADYWPVREELQTIYWRRMNTENERFQKQLENEFKELFKHQHSTKKALA